MMTSPLLGARRIRELFETHGIRPHKELGQNFVIDPNTIRKVVDVARLSEHDSVIEIGAGAGSLTLGLAAAAERVTAVEFDSRVVPALRESLAGVTNVDVVEADAMKLDFAAVDATSLVANLPYNIAVPLVSKVLEDAPQVSSLTVMTQREVGERLAARPGSKAYGQVSVLVAYRASARVAARISRNAFWPVPAVDSVLVRIDRRREADVDYAVFRRAVRTAFQQRRKTLRNTLSEVAGSPAAAEAVLAQANVEPAARPEAVDLDGWVAISESLVEHGVAVPERPS